MSAYPYHQPYDEELGRVLQKNLNALVEYRERMEHRQTVEERWAARISGWAGSMRFVYLHAFLVAFWIAYNTISPFPRFDPYPFVGLSVLVSTEALFLATFILISQNRMNDLSERRADLDVQFSLLAEHELTQLIRIVDAVAARLGVRSEEITDIQELTREIPPEAVLDRLDRERRNGKTGKRR